MQHVAREYLTIVPAARDADNSDPIQCHHQGHISHTFVPWRHSYDIRHDCPSGMKHLTWRIQLGHRSFSDRVLPRSCSLYLPAILGSFFDCCATQPSTIADKMVRRCCRKVKQGHAIKHVVRLSDRIYLQKLQGATLRRCGTAVACASNSNRRP